MCLHIRIQMYTKNMCVYIYIYMYVCLTALRELTRIAEGFTAPVADMVKEAQDAKQRRDKCLQEL